MINIWYYNEKTRGCIAMDVAGFIISILSLIVSVVGVIISLWVLHISKNVKEVVEEFTQKNILKKSVKNKKTSILIDLDSHIQYFLNIEAIEWDKAKNKIMTLLGRTDPYNALFKQQEKDMIKKLEDDAIYMNRDSAEICRALSGIKAIMQIIIEE